MVTYKEFEILNYLTRFQGNTNGAFWPTWSSICTTPSSTLPRRP